MADVLQQAAAQGRFDDAEGSSTETAWAYDEPYVDDDDDDAYDEAADAMEVAEMGERFGSAVRLAPMTKSHAASNAAEGAERKANRAKNTGLTRDERATTEQVLDPRTRLLLFKLLNAGTLSSINGCVSTGKEANVYHAEGKDGEYAIKVYKTSILIFKDRDRCDHARAAAPLACAWPSEPEPKPGPALAWSAEPEPEPEPFPRQVRERRVPLPSRLLQVQPAQDGAHVGGEGGLLSPLYPAYISRISPRCACGRRRRCATTGGSPRRACPAPRRCCSRSTCCSCASSARMAGRRRASRTLRSSPRRGPPPGARRVA